MTDQTSNTGDQGGQLFKNMDEMERVYGGEGVPGTNIPEHEVDADATAGTHSYRESEPPAAAPIANIGSSPSSSAAPPNVAGHDEHGGAPGDPETQAGYPIENGQNTHEGEPRTT